MSEIEYTMIWFVQLLTVVVLVALAIKISDLAETIRSIVLSVNKLAFISQACTTYLASLQRERVTEEQVRSAQAMVDG